MLIREYIAKKHTFIKYMITRQLKNSEKTYTTPKFFCQRGSQRYLVKKMFKFFRMLRFLCRCLLDRILANRLSKSTVTIRLTIWLQDASSVLKSLVFIPKTKTIIVS